MERGIHQPEGGVSNTLLGRLSERSNGNDQIIQPSRAHYSKAETPSDTNILPCTFAGNEKNSVNLRSEDLVEALRSSYRSRKSHVYDLVSSSLVKTRISRMSNIHITISEADDILHTPSSCSSPFESSPSRYFPATPKSPTGDKLIQLGALSEVLGTISTKDGFTDHASMANLFELNNISYKEYEDYETGKIDTKAILIDACIEMDIDTTEKLAFLFKIVDSDNTGKVSRKQMIRMLKSSFSSAKLSAVGFDYDKMVNILFQRARVFDYSKCMDFNEFCAVFGTYVSQGPETSARMTQNPHEVSHQRKFEAFIDHYGSRFLLVTFYIVLNLIAFFLKYYKYEVDPCVGYGLRIARGSAQVIMLNCVFVLVPMCRGIVAVLKSNKDLWKYVPFDETIEFHKISGSVLLISGIIHTIAHLANIYILYKRPNEEAYSHSVYSSIPGFEEAAPPLTAVLLKLPIWTGIVLIIITIISFPLAAVPRFRQGQFNLFWYSHMLFGPFMLIMCVHGALSWLATSTAYLWIIPPFLLYLIERRFRYAKVFSQPIKIVRTQTFDETVALFLKKPKWFNHTPGMYLFLNIPAVSTHEWHPFTISSAPDDEYISLHIRNAGDWTGALHNLIKKCNHLKVKHPIAYIDGPVGAPTQEYHRYKTIVMIGGGIGVTPFASILKDTVHLWKDYQCCNCKHVSHPKRFRIQKMYFHWVTRGQSSLSWFEDTMNQISAMDTGNIIEMHQYLSSVKENEDSSLIKLFQELIHKETGKDLVSGLSGKKTTHFGRPDWARTFSELQSNHSGETVGVFFCGPHALDKILRDLCIEYSSDPTKGGVFFDYHSENFS